MRRRFVIGLVFVNALLASALMVKPADTQVMPMGLFDCCKEEAGTLKGGYCCAGCCWWIMDCNTDRDCQVQEEQVQQEKTVFEG
jgi:hypothetical protein